MLGFFCFKEAFYRSLSTCMCLVQTHKSCTLLVVYKHRCIWKHDSPTLSGGQSLENLLLLVICVEDIVIPRADVYRISDKYIYLIWLWRYWHFSVLPVRGRHLISLCHWPNDNILKVWQRFNHSFLRYLGNRYTDTQTHRCGQKHNRPALSGGR